MERRISALALVLAFRPDLPVHCIRSHAARRAAEWFVQSFPGETFYAVKANPHPLILDAVSEAGVRSFDVASVQEIERVAARFPNAHIAFMHPVKARSSIRRAYHEFGVRTFALDSADELNKIVAETAGAKDLRLIVRLAAASDYAAHKLAGKFGAAGSEAVMLLRETRVCAEALGVSFHVGSQCMRPEAYRLAMAAAGELIRQASVTVDIVDVGGGFPAPYPGLVPPPLEHYAAEIAAAFETMPVLENAGLWCEPGRALCAEAGSHVTRVELRKNDALYINDGAYGALFDAAHDGLVFPARVLRRGDAPPRPLAPYRLFGPTCDSIDAMPGPFFLPDDVSEGDYIEFGLTGAYGAALAGKFNGFGEYLEAVVEDAPIYSMYDSPANENVAAATGD
ncbi:MAG: type III PLP-dependent enzyme [Parvularculaceae bacterium]